MISAKVAPLGRAISSDLCALGLGATCDFATDDETTFAEFFTKNEHHLNPGLLYQFWIHGAGKRSCEVPLGAAEPASPLT
jgi:hypothetical protein